MLKCVLLKEYHVSLRPSLRIAAARFRGLGLRIQDLGLGLLGFRAKAKDSGCRRI